MDPNQPTQPTDQPGVQVPTDQTVPQPAPTVGETPAPAPETVPVQPETVPTEPTEQPKEDTGGEVPPVAPPAPQV